MVLFYNRGGVAYNKTYFGEGKGPILLDSVGCQGTEENLNLCILGYPDLKIATCTHKEDAGVECDKKAPKGTPNNVVNPPQLGPLSPNCGQGNFSTGLKVV